MRRKNTKKIDAVIIAVLVFLCTAIYFAAAKDNNEDNNNQPNQTQEQIKLSYKDYAGKKIGAQTSTTFDMIITDNIPDAQISHFNNYTDMIGALLANKIDAFVTEEPVAKCMGAENPEISYIKDYLEEYDLGYALSKTDKGKQLCDEFSEYIKKIKSDGTLKEIDEIWCGKDKSKQIIPPLNELSGENGVLKYAVEAAYEPFVFIKNNQIVGYDIDIVYRFCKEYGYGLEIKDMNFDAIIPAIQSGKSDLGSCGMAITEERLQCVNFTEPYYSGGAVIVVRSSDIANKQQQSSDDVNWRNYNGKKIAILTGSAFEKVTFDFFPDSEYLYYNNYSDMNIALSKGIIDGYICDEPTGRIIHSEQSSIDFIKEMIKEDTYSFVFPKNVEKSEKLCKQLNEFFEKAKNDGVLDELNSIWLGEDEDKKVVDFSDTENNPEKLKVIISSTLTPFTYIKDGEYVGYAIDLFTRFCREYGYSMEIEDSDSSALIAGVSLGKYDLAVGPIGVTPEREESLLFTDPFYYGGMVLMVRSEDIKGDSAAVPEAGDNSFLDNIKSSFEKNFIRESRWKLIVEGITVTLTLTFFSTVIGTILAFLICIFRRTESRLAVFLCNIYVKILQGTPAVVLLMILYYIVFGKTTINAGIVAIIGFSLNFAAYVSEMMRSGIESIDPGQREAALALGFTERQAFYKFIFPQAVERILPIYRGEIISLLKNTSIVGYIAIQDLTKMSDIIRSRTYEAFFPLIVTALIYFMLSWVISRILSKIAKAMDKKSKRAEVKALQEN